MVVQGNEMPSVFGASAPYKNIGELTTKGWELALDFNHTFANQLKLRVNANISDARTVITKHPNRTKSLNGSNYEGRVLGEIWGFETDRFFTADDFNPDGTLKANIPDQSRFLEYSGTSGIASYLPGDIKYKDLDGNGVIDRGDFILPRSRKPPNLGEWKLNHPWIPIWRRSILCTSNRLLDTRKSGCFLCTFV